MYLDVHVSSEPVVRLNGLEDLHGGLRPVGVALELIGEMRLQTEQLFHVSVYLDPAGPVVAQEDVWRRIR